MKTFTVEVTQTVEVTLDETKFDETFMSDFRACFYPFDTVQEHAAHIAKLQARGVITEPSLNEFIEGYGPCADMGISARVAETEMNVIGETVS